MSVDTIVAGRVYHFVDEFDYPLSEGIVGGQAHSTGALRLVVDSSCGIEPVGEILPQDEVFRQGFEVGVTDSRHVDFDDSLATPDNRVIEESGPCEPHRVGADNLL